MDRGIIVGVIALVVSIIVLLIRKDRQEKKQTKQSSAMYDTVPSQTIPTQDKMLSSFTHMSITQPLFQQVYAELQKKIVGQQGFLYGLFVSLLVPGGHVLVEGVPGLAKTKTIASLAQAVEMSFSRIQFTPDMLPGDITGIELFNTEKKQFELMKGPIFAHIILADEINRTTPKVQSALLEAMQEQQVTIGNETLPLPKPFFVLATQNPLEHEGTYALPEAQLDRFLMKIILDYPTSEQEYKILDLVEQGDADIGSCMHATDLLQAQEEVATVSLSSELKQYIVGLVAATRKSSSLQYGASPRASIALMQGAKAVAWLQGRMYVVREDIEKISLPILRHRVVLTYTAQAEGKKIDEVLIELL